MNNGFREKLLWPHHSSQANRSRSITNRTAHRLENIDEDDETGVKVKRYIMHFLITLARHDFDNTTWLNYTVQSLISFSAWCNTIDKIYA